MSVDPDTDKIELLEKVLKLQENLVYYKMNKPRGIVTTCAQNDEKSILDVLDIKERVFPI
jgi:16S rRNA U516 pseudouridylate synthase RsuA-like enzyme